MGERSDVQPLYVSKFYEMDPEVDDLVPDGTYLRHGMVVLIEDSMIREDEQRAGDRWADARLRENNRWCEVTYLKVTPRYGETRSPLVEFIGVYPDGTKRKRAFDASFAWLVRRFSLNGETP